MSNNIEFRILGDARDLEKNLAKSSQVLTKFGKSMTTFVTLPLLAAGVGFVKLASDAEETGNKFNVVFASMQKQASDWSKSFGDSVGRSTEDIQRFSSGLGDVLKPLGFTTEEAFRLSSSMTQLALDVASFNNRQDSDVIRAFTSALTGERESLKTLGIVISEADVKQEAYSSGIARTGAELTKTQKAQATVNLLYKNTADAQGDLLRTQDSFANQLKALQASSKDLGISLGQILLPAATDLVRALKELSDNFASLNPETQKSIIGFAGFLAIIGPVSFLIGGTIAGFKALSVATIFLTGEIAFLEVGLVTLAGSLVALTGLGIAAFAGWKVGELINEINLLNQATNTLNASEEEFARTQAESLRARGVTQEEVTAFAAMKAAEQRQTEIDSTVNHNEVLATIQTEENARRLQEIATFQAQIVALTDMQFVNMQNGLLREIELTKTAEQQKTKIIQDELKSRDALRQADKSSQLALLDFASQMTMAFGKESKAAFLILKAIKIGEILVNSFAADMNIQSVWAWNPPVAASLISNNHILTALSIAGVIGTAIAGFAVGSPNVPNDMVANIHRGETIIPATFAEGIREGDLTLSGGSDSGGSTPTFNFSGAIFNGVTEDFVRKIFTKASESITNRTLAPLPV